MLVASALDVVLVLVVIVVTVVTVVVDSENVCLLHPNVCEKLLIEIESIFQSRTSVLSIVVAFDFQMNFLWQN